MKIIPDEIRLFFTFSSVEPIPEDDLLSHLRGMGFDEIKEIPKRLGTETFGIERLNIARSGRCEIIYDPRRGRLGIVGNNSQEVLQKFEQLESMLRDMGFDFSSQLKFFEFSSDNRIFVKGKRPLQNIANFLEVEKFSKFKEIVGTEVAPFCIRFYPKDKINTVQDFKEIPKWFDFHIYPFVPNPQYHALKIIFRDNDISNVKNFVKEVDNKILRIIELIQSG